MLHPNVRKVYTNELSPPPGFKFDRAIATTFSLDLLTLLVTPLSLALFDIKNKDEVLKDQIAVIEALQRTIDRLGIFCQQGRILIPKNETLLYNYLEKAVVEVQPPKGTGVFHPKIWLLRYIDDEDNILYRFICLTRNLTFDQSWDIVLTLEGNLEKGRKNAFSRNRPLSHFIRSLPDLSVNGVPEIIKEHVDLLADEVLRVKFEAPQDFEEDFTFHPIGISGYKKGPSFDKYSRLLVVSPFLSESVLQWQVQKGTANILISRGDSLDAIDNETIKNLQKRTDIFMLDEKSEYPAEAEIEALETGDDLIDEDRSGLHAKLYIVETGWDARVLTGSANATEAGFNGDNVEFLVELTGKKSRVGIDRFLGEEEDKTSVRNLLRAYQRPEEPVSAENNDRKELEKGLEEARQNIAKANLFLTVHPENDESYSLVLEPKESLSFGEVITKACCYPITLKFTDSNDLAPLSRSQPVVFKNISKVSLTGFLAFYLEGKYGTEKAKLTFLLNLPVYGMPSDRDKRILQTIIADKNRFLRYLLFLLAEESESTFGDEWGTIESAGRGLETAAGTDLPLVEELVRAYSRTPHKLNRIKKLIHEIAGDPQSKDLLPEGFDKIWEAFEAVETER